MWEIRRRDLVKGLEILGMVPEKLGIPSSEFLWIRGKGRTIKMSVASYIGGEVELRGHGEWPFEHSIFIDRRMLMPFVYIAKELKNKAMFQFERHHKELLVRHGKRIGKFTSQDKVRGYDDLKRILSAKSSSFPATEDVRELLMCGRHCTISDSIVPEKDCVYVSRSNGGLVIQAYASSDKVYYIGKGKLREGKIRHSVPFPLFLINLLATDGLEEIAWKGKCIVLRFDKGYVWQPISEEALRKFPKATIQKYAGHADKLPVTFTASSRRFARLMIRIGYYLQSVRRKDWVVKVIGKKGKESVTVTSSIAGARFSEQIVTAEKLRKDFELKWPLNMLDPIFEFLSTKTKKMGVIVRIDDKHGVSYISVGNFWLAVTSRQE